MATPSPWVYETFTITEPSAAAPSPWVYQSFTITDPPATIAVPVETVWTGTAWVPSVELAWSGTAWQ